MAAAVPQKTLNWLYFVLTKASRVSLPLSESWLTTDQEHYDARQTYHDPNRTYYDVASALAQYPSLTPRTDVYSEFC